MDSQLIGSSGYNESMTTIKGNIKIYPNPSSNKFNIELISHKNGFRNKNGFELTIFNLLGMRTLSKLVGSNKTIIDASNWESGIYFCEIKSAEKRFVKKIVIE